MDPEPQKSLPRRLVDLQALDAIRRNEQTRLMLLGVLVGALGGVSAALFDGLTVLTGRLLLGTSEPSVADLPELQTIGGPVIGAIVVGAIVTWLVREQRPRGIADVIAAVGIQGGRVSSRDGVASAAAAAIAIGSGHSGGREGPIVQLASSLASTVCRRLDIAPRRVRVLVAAGAAAGIAASFNTPIGGAFFAMELLLGSFALEGFAPVVAATVTGTVVGQALLGERLALDLPPFDLVSPVELLIYPLLGVLCGGVAIGLKEIYLRAAEAWQDMPVPPVFRPVAPGLAAGLFAVFGLPAVMGNGYAFVERMLEGDASPAWLLVLVLVAKVATTALSVAGRTGVGVFAPTLFVGAITGTLFGMAAQALLPGNVAPVGAYGMVGMGAVVAALAQSPITMALMLFEMTGNYQIVLPVLLTIAVSGVVFRAAEGRSLYLGQLRRAGIELDRKREELVMYELRVADVMRREIVALPVHAPFERLARKFLERRLRDVFVVDEEGRYHGLIDIQDVKGLLGQPHEELSVDDVERRDVPSLLPDLALAEAMPYFFRHDLEELPVVDEHGKLVGVLTERDVVAAYHREVLRKESLLARIESGMDAERRVDFLELPEGQRLGVMEVTAAYAGRTLRDLDLPGKFGVTVVAVDVWDPDRGRHGRIAARADLALHAQDRLVVLGPEPAVQDLCRAHGECEEPEA
ncbi:MAG: chloride channel protein [Alphaproteobacteria bacterium]|nr:chloride channel protein [Alphaproteobacteria bacterium]